MPLCLKRDAAAKLPRNIGTREGIGALLRSSQYIAEGISNIEVNPTVQGGLSHPTKPFPLTKPIRTYFLHLIVSTLTFLPSIFMKLTHRVYPSKPFLSSRIIPLKALPFTLIFNLSTPHIHHTHKPMVWPLIHCIPTNPFSPTVSLCADNFSCIPHPFPSHHFPSTCMVLIVPTLLPLCHGIPRHHAHSLTSSWTLRHLFSLYPAYP